MNNFPNDFNFDLYRLFYTDLRNYDNNFLRNHYIECGRKEGRHYKLPNDFTVESYKSLNNDLKHLNNNDLMIHYINNGIKEGRKYCKEHKKIENSSKKNVIFVVARYNEDISNFAEYNNNLVLTNCIAALKDYFIIDKWQINEPIMLKDLFILLDKIDGVQTVKNVSITNKVGTALGYSQYNYDIAGATQSNIIYPSLDPMIFEVKNPDSDIKGRVVTF
jgi:hypothetical protein